MQSTLYSDVDHLADFFWPTKPYGGKTFDRHERMADTHLADRNLADIDFTEGVKVDLNHPTKPNLKKPLSAI